MRFFLVDNDPQRLRAEWRAISWYDDGENALTANLAIWCLVIIALNEDHRKIEVRAKTLPINI